MGLFDDFAKEYGEDPTPETDPVDRVVQELDDEEIDDELREAEKRLSKAAYYKVIVRNGVIEDDGSPEASEINAEARLWARQMMVKLLKGSVPEEQKVEIAPLFNEREVMVLKKIIEKVLLAQGEKPVDPVIKKVPAQPAAPQVKTIKTNKPPTPGKPPAKKPPQSPPAAAAAAKPPTKNAPKKPFKPKVDSSGEIDYDSIPTGEMFKDKDGHFYKFVPHPQEDNTRIKLKVTGQIRNPNALPMPNSKQQMEALSHSQATASLNTGAPGNTNFPDHESVGTDMMVAAAATSLRDS